MDGEKNERMNNSFDQIFSKSIGHLIFLIEPIRMFDEQRQTDVTDVRTTKHKIQRAIFVRQYVFIVFLFQT